MTLETTIERNDTEIPISVEYNYYKGCRGIHDKYGAPETPDEPPEIEIESAISNTGAIELSYAEERKVEERIWQALADRRHGYID